MSRDVIIDCQSICREKYSTYTDIARIVIVDMSPGRSPIVHWPPFCSRMAEKLRDRIIIRHQSLASCHCQPGGCRGPWEHYSLCTAFYFENGAGACRTCPDPNLYVSNEPCA